MADIRGKEESDNEDDMFMADKPVEVSHPPLSFKGMVCITSFFFFF